MQNTHTRESEHSRVDTCTTFGVSQSQRTHLTMLRRPGLPSHPARTGAGVFHNNNCMHSYDDDDDVRECARAHLKRANVICARAFTFASQEPQSHSA